MNRAFFGCPARSLFPV